MVVVVVACAVTVGVAGGTWSRARTAATERTVPPIAVASAAMLITIRFRTVPLMSDDLQFLS